MVLIALIFAVDKPVDCNCSLVNCANILGVILRKLKVSLCQIASTTAEENC